MNDPFDDPRTKVSGKSWKRGLLDDDPLADELLDASVVLIRQLGIARRTGDDSCVPKLLDAEARIKRHFPRLRRREVVQLARVLVHIGSVSLRHAMGLTVVLPSGPIPKKTSKRRGEPCHAVWTDKEMTQSLPLIDALRQLFRVKPRLTTHEVLGMMKERGWTPASEAKSISCYVRDFMGRSSEFRRAGRRGRYVVWRWKP